MILYIYYDIHKRMTDILYNQYSKDINTPHMKLTLGAYKEFTITKTCVASIQLLKHKSNQNGTQPVEPSQLTIVK